LNGVNYGDKLTFVGEGSNPLWIGKRREVQSLFDQDFHMVYTIWRKVHIGWGWPDGKPWGDQDPEIVDIVETMEYYHRYKWSFEAAALKGIQETAAYTGVMARGKRIK